MLSLVGHDPRTTAVGALAGSVNYLDQVGVGIPSNRNEWLGFVFSLLLFAFGRLAADAPKG